MTTMMVRIDVIWKNSKVWGMIPDATVRTELFGVRGDTTYGSASGCGYDKESAAVCSAVRSNPLLETLGLWDEFVPVNDYGNVFYGLYKNDYGYSFDFSGKGVSEFRKVMVANGFTESDSSHGAGYDSYTYYRDMPKSFVKLV